MKPVSIPAYLSITRSNFFPGFFPLLIDSIFSSTFKSDRMRLVLTQAPRLTDTTADDAVDICPTSVLILVFHGGSILDNSSTIDLNGNRADISTFTSCFDTVLNAHYPSLLGHVVVKGVRCPPICAEALTVLSRYVSEIRQINSVFFI